MSVAIDFFDLAQLAEASYAKFDETDDLKLALMKDGDGFSSTQADLFLADWQIKNGGHRPNTDSGFSSTLFQDKHDPTRYVLAIRGTEPETLEDLASDIGDIAIDQIVDLYNEWQRISRNTYNAAQASNGVTSKQRGQVLPFAIPDEPR